jgi:hypothetical protein
VITLEEFLKRFPGRVDRTTKDDLQLFIDTVTNLSDDYETFVSRLRATGKFKSLFGNFGASRTTNISKRFNRKTGEVICRATLRGKFTQ